LVLCCLRRAPPPPPLFPYTTLFRSGSFVRWIRIVGEHRPPGVILPVDPRQRSLVDPQAVRANVLQPLGIPDFDRTGFGDAGIIGDRKSTRLNSSHVKISYAVFCLKK